MPFSADSTRPIIKGIPRTDDGSRVASSEVFSSSVQGRLFEISENAVAKPFLKWAGGKTRLLPALRRYIPPAFGTYFEPFLGGGALFFDVAPDSAVLGDSNPELIGCYQVVTDYPDLLINELAKFIVSESEYYRVRAQMPEDLSPVQRAARFIYLNKTCYNGLYRVNKKGNFNTPFGKYTKANFVDQENLLSASNLLKSASLIRGDYSAVVQNARRGDFVYFDPPYLPVSKFSDFKRYTKEFFYEEDHEKLAQTFATLADKGCHVLLSNSFHEKIADMYSRFHQEKVLVPRFVNCKGEGRGYVTELLISNDEPRN
jgi:DNA adenine methylase